ncbi:MAG TPA: GTP-binding protein, partial [Pseudoduganella sp.]
GIGGFDSGVALIDPDFLAGHEDHGGHACDEHCKHAGHTGHAAHGPNAAYPAPEGVCGLPGNGPAGHGHAHDPSVDSVSLTFAAPFDRRQLDTWLARLLQAQGDDLFRLKGILAIHGEQRRHVLQAVHRVMDLRPADAWPAGAPRLSKLVFIGRNLDRDTLKAGLDWCLAAPTEAASLTALEA